MAHGQFYDKQAKHLQFQLTHGMFNEMYAK